MTSDGYLPSVFPLLAAIAMRTSRVRHRLGDHPRPVPAPDPLRRGRRLRRPAERRAARDRPRPRLPARASSSCSASRSPSAPAAPRSWSTTARRVWADGTVTPPPFQQPEPPFWIGGSGSRRGPPRRPARLLLHARRLRPDRGDRALPLARRHAHLDQPVGLRRRLGRRRAALPLPVQPLPRVGRRRSSSRAPTSCRAIAT